MHCNKISGLMKLAFVNISLSISLLCGKYTKNSSMNILILFRHSAHYPSLHDYNQKFAYYLGNGVLITDFSSHFMF